MPKKDNKFSIVIDKFFQGFSPTHWKNSLSEFGNAGMANEMTDCDILTPEFIRQGLGKAILTNGDEVGEINELVNFILDKPTSDGVTFAIAATKLHKLSNTAVSSGGTPSWPRIVTGMTRGESIAYLKGNLYYFSEDDIGKYDLSSTFNDDWGSTVPTGAASLQNKKHPVAVKEDLMVFGNGRYLGIYTDGGSLAPTKLDFGNNTEVADVLFHNNKWIIAVNSDIADDSNRGEAHIYEYDGAAVSTLLDNEISLGSQNMGFIKVVNGIIYVAFQDLSSSGGYKLGYIAGNQIKTLTHFEGSLPTFRQKTLYKNLIAFIADSKVYLHGTVSEELPLALSQIATPTRATVGAIAAPFGSLLVASYAGSNYELEKFSGYSVTSNWTSLTFNLIQDRKLGYMDEIIVCTNKLGANARCDITLQFNDNESNSGAKQIATDDYRRHVITALSNRSDIENFRIYLNWANGNVTNQADIRKIIINGHWLER